MSDRFIVAKAEVLNKMRPIDISNVDDVRKFYKITEMVSMPERKSAEKDDSLTPRQYAVAKNAFSRAQEHNASDSWWEIYSFVEASEHEILSFIELQMLCMMLSLWLYSVGIVT